MLNGLADIGMQFTFLPRYAGGLTTKYRGICWICSAEKRYQQRRIKVEHHGGASQRHRHAPIGLQGIPTIAKSQLIVKLTRQLLESYAS